MTVYIDEVFLLNAMVDYLLLLCAGRLTGEVLRRGRLALAAALGGLYASAVLLPGWAFLNRPLCRVCAGVALALTAYGGAVRLCRVTLTFFGVSAAFGGGVLALQYLSGAPAVLDLKTTLLAAAGCYAFLTLIFRGGVRHTGGELAQAELRLDGRRCRLTALADTGNTLSDPLTGRPVMVAEGEKVSSLFPVGEAPTAGELSDPVSALARRGGHRWRLLPYRTVGTSCALLLAVKVDGATVAGEDWGSILVALSPTPVSDGGGYHALIGA